MIGQNKVLEKIDNLIEKGFPRFLIITGPKGQGKKELAKYIMCKLDNYYKDKLADKGGCYMIQVGTKIDEIREMIQMAYKQSEPIIYLIADADKMSIGAKNSLLKVIEEPPNNAYFILTLEQIENTLPTIKSRCTELKMEEYSIDEIEEMIYKINPNTSKIEECIIEEVAFNYYEIQLLFSYGVEEFYDYVKKVFDHIYKVQSANAFKLSEKLALKNEEDKYNVELFLRTYRNLCMDELLNYAELQDTLDFEIYSKCINETSNILRQLSINGINKASLIDMWILNIRRIWRNG